MHTLLTLLTLWLAANLLHAAWVQSRRHCWERRNTRDADGLLPNAAAFTVGKGPIALLLIHGFADTPRIWKRMADYLAASGAFTCRAMRLPGSAQRAPLAKNQSLTLWQQAVDKELDSLHATHSAVWAIGHSLGGALAIDAALRRTEAIGGVAVFSPMIEVSKKRSPLLPPVVWFRLASFTLGLSPVFESCFSADGIAVDDPSFTYKRDRFIPFCVYRSLFELIRSNRSRSASLACPVFAVTAERDSVVDTPAALRWLAGCTGPKRVLHLTDIGHVIPLETGWQAQCDNLSVFIREQNSKRPQASSERS